MSRTRQTTPHGNAGRGYYAEIRDFLQFCKTGNRVSRMSEIAMGESQKRKILGKSGFFRVSFIGTKILKGY